MLELFVELGERGINCFEAADRHHDYVLRSTVSGIERAFGLHISRSEDRVRNAFGGVTICTRYRLIGAERERARELLGMEGR